MESSQGKPFSTSEPDLTIYADACFSGCGAFCNGTKTRGSWGPSDRNKHINELKLLAAFNAIRCFMVGSLAISVLIFLDNSTAVCYLNKGGGTKSRSLTSVAKSITAWCESRKISLEARHVPGLLNVVAHQECRAATDSSDWRLSVSLFDKINTLWPVDIDLFASHWNAQLDRFVSWLAQRDAFAVKAFSLNWSCFKGNAFPPLI